MPNFDPAKILAEKEMTKSIPTGKGWFSRDALKQGEVGKFVKAISTSIGDWISAVHNTKDALYLSTATGEDLDLWGKDLKLPRKLGESDNLYRARLIRDILSQKLTKPAIENYLNTELDFDSNIYLPWQYIDIRGNNLNAADENGYNPVAGRSGMTKRSSLYYTAGVIDVISEGWDPAIRQIVDSTKGAPIKPYFTSQLNPGSVVSYGEQNVSHIRYLERLTFVPIVPPTNGVSIRGDGTPRSGRIEINSNKIIFRFSIPELYDTGDDSFGWVDVWKWYTMYAEQWDADPNTYTPNRAIYFNLSAYPLETALPFTYSEKQFLPKLPTYGYAQVWDHPASYTTNTDFRATSQTWESVGDLTWDELVLGTHDRQQAGQIILEN